VGTVWTARGRQPLPVSCCQQEDADPFGFCDSFRMSSQTSARKIGLGTERQTHRLIVLSPIKVDATTRATCVCQQSKTAARAVLLAAHTTAFELPAHRLLRDTESNRQRVPQPSRTGTASLMLRKQNVEVLIGLIWLRLRSTAGLFRTPCSTWGLYEWQWISVLAERLEACQREVF
jgi:hypothetical protein